MGIELPRYTETDDELRVTAGAAINYIFGGDTLDAVYDLRGLHVFAVIAALRENDDRFHGEVANLSDDQRTRLSEVERIVDAAVEMGMHYYPFGDYQNKQELPGIILNRGSASTSSVTRTTKRGGGNPKISRRKRKEQYTRTTQNGPVITTRIVDGQDG